MSSAVIRGAALALLALGTLACRPEITLPAPVVASSIRIAVMPFRVNGDLDQGGTFRAGGDPGTMDDLLGEQIGQRLITELAALDVSVVPIGDVLRATPPPGAAIYDVDLAARVGAAVSADYIVLGAIGRYREREGSSLGVESPASVAYRCVLVDVGRRSHAGSYDLDYTQQPLAEDLTQLPQWLQGRIGWLTRDEILESALSRTARQIARTVENATTR